MTRLVPLSLKTPHLMADVAAQLHPGKLHQPQPLIGPGKGLIEVISLRDHGQHPTATGLQSAVGAFFDARMKDLTGVSVMAECCSLIIDDITKLR